MGRVRVTCQAALQIHQHTDVEFSHMLKVAESPCSSIILIPQAHSNPKSLLVLRSKTNRIPSERCKAFGT
jgi:hypothetical protein